jgi:hypothetical protein
MQYHYGHLDQLYILGKKGNVNEVEHLWNEAENHLKEVKDSLIEDEHGPSFYGLNYLNSYVAGFAIKNDEVNYPKNEWEIFSLPLTPCLIFEVEDDVDEVYLEALKIMKEKGEKPSLPYIEHYIDGVLYLYVPLKTN